MQVAHHDHLNAAIDLVAEWVKLQGVESLLAEWEDRQCFVGVHLGVAVAREVLAAGYDASIYAFISADWDKCEHSGYHPAGDIPLLFS